MEDSDDDELFAFAGKRKHSTEDSECVGHLAQTSSSKRCCGPSKLDMALAKEKEKRHHLEEELGACIHEEDKWLMAAGLSPSKTSTVEVSNSSPSGPSSTGKCLAKLDDFKKELNSRVSEYETSVPADANTSVEFTLNAFKRWPNRNNSSVVETALTSLGISADWKWGSFQCKSNFLHPREGIVPEGLCISLFDIAVLQKNSCQCGLLLFGLLLGRPISLEDGFRRLFVPHHRIFKSFDKKKSKLGWRPTLAHFLKAFQQLGMPLDFVRHAPRPPHAAEWENVKTALFVKTIDKPANRPYDEDERADTIKNQMVSRYGGGETDMTSGIASAAGPFDQKPPILNLEFLFGFLAACLEVGNVDIEQERAVIDEKDAVLTDIEQTLAILLLALCDEHSGNLDIAVRATKMLWERSTQKNRRQVELKLKEFLCHQKLISLPSILSRFPLSVTHQGDGNWETFKRNIAMESIRSWWPDGIEASPSWLCSDEVADVGVLQEMVSGLKIIDIEPRSARFLYICNLFDLVVDFVAWQWLSKNKSVIKKFLETIEKFEEFLISHRQMDLNLYQLLHSASFCKSKFSCLLDTAT